MTTGERIAKCRKDKKISQEYVAEQLDVTRQAVSKWETDVNVPDTQNFIKLARLLGTTVEYLACGDELITTDVKDTSISDSNSGTSNGRERVGDKKQKPLWVNILGFIIFSLNFVPIIALLLLKAHIAFFILPIIFSIVGWNMMFK